MQCISHFLRGVNAKGSVSLPSTGPHESGDQMTFIGHIPLWDAVINYTFHTLDGGKIVRLSYVKDNFIQE